MRQLLEAKLKPGETLLSFTSAKLYSVGSKYNGKSALVGLTQSRLFIVPMKVNQPLDRIFNFARRDLTSFGNQNNIISPTLQGFKLQYGEDALTVHSQGSWLAHAKDLLNIHNQNPVDPIYFPPVTTGDAYIQFMQDLTDLGIYKFVGHELNKVVYTDPVLATDPRIISNKQFVNEIRFAFRVGAVFFIGEIVSFILLAALGLAQLNIIGIVINVILIYNLWLGKKSWKSYAIFLAVITTFVPIYAAFSLMAQKPDIVIYIVIWISYLISVILVLTGRSNRTRTLIAVAIYAVGFVGTTALAFLLGIIK